MLATVWIRRVVPARARATEAGCNPGALSRHGWWTVASLAETQTAGYAVLYYAYAVFLTPMASAAPPAATLLLVA